MTLARTSRVGADPAAPSGTSRLFAAGVTATYQAHCDTYRPLDIMRVGSGLIERLADSGLGGRGGAGFAVSRKFEATVAARLGRFRSKRAVVIANGAEGEPRSIKDETLMLHAPHLVIDGLLVAGAAVGASALYLYATAKPMDSVRHAISERNDAGAILLVEAPETFISGEASAVVNAIETGIALPVDRTVRLSASGLRRQPTLVHNVETLAHVALVARFGAEWFRSIGSERDPGTRLVTVSGSVVAERVLEVPGDTRVGDIIGCCGAQREQVAAVLVGGYHGAWVAAENLDAPLSAAGLRPFGAQPGAGILYVLDRHECGLQATAQIVRYLAGESAQQCGPCRFGLPEMATLLTRIASGATNPGLRRELAELSRSVVGRGSCHHPDGTSRLVLNALDVFADDVQAHLVGRCSRLA